MWALGGVFAVNFFRGKPAMRNAAGCLLAAAVLPLLPNRFEPQCPRVRHAPRAAILQDVAPQPSFVEALDAERAAEIWARRPAGSLPNADRQAELIEWLKMGPLAHDPDRLLYTCLRNEPRLLKRASSLPALRETHAALVALLREDLSPKRLAELIASEPGLLLRASFFVRVIGGSPAELVAVPHMLTCDLGKVPMLRHAYCLTQGIDVKPIQLLVKGDVTFCTEVAGCDIEEFNAFEADGKHLAFFQGAGI